MEHSDKLSWRKLSRSLLQHRRALLVANAVALLAVIASVPIPLLMPLMVDEVLLHQPGTLLHYLNAMYPHNWHEPITYISSVLLATVVLRLLSLLFNALQSRQFTLVAQDITFDIRRRLLQNLQRVSMAEFETLGSASVNSHLVTDVNAVDEFLGNTISRALVSLLSLVGITAILLWMHWQLALFILFVNPVVIYFTMVLGKKVKQLKRRENHAFEVFQQALAETLDGIQQIRASNKERHYVRRAIDRAADIRTSAAQFSWKSDVANRFSMGIFLIGFDIFRALSMLMVVFSGLSIGEMMAVFGYLWFMMTPVQELLNIHYACFAANAALERLNKLLALRHEPSYPHRHNPFAGKQTVAVQLENICFRYGQRGPRVLSDVNLRIEAGEKVALVGASGGGKSTLVQVILGMYTPEKGMLYFDDVPVTQIGLDVVRSHVATVLQQPAMFNDTVRQNLAFGTEVSEQKMLDALSAAQLEETFNRWPEGLDTIIGSRGIRLSGGQRQRLAIARLLLSDPKVVILDEATSALDTQTEFELHRALEAFLHQRTTLIIAHRLSAVKQAERVYVFDGGSIAEQGGHDDLLKQQGIYSRLYGHLQR